MKTYNIAEFAELVGVSTKTLRRLDKSGDLVADRVLNNQYRYTDEHVGLFKKARENYLHNKSIKNASQPHDLSHQRFGKLFVIKQVDDNISPKGAHRRQWLCKCDCGQYTLALDGSLRAGYKKSCGCLLHGDNQTKHMRDEFDKLSEFDAEEILKTIPHNAPGKAKNRPGGGTLQNLKGQHFGLWTVLERGETRHYKNGGQAVCWVCKCECGTIKTVPGRDLKSGASQSCGCASSISWLEFYTKQYLLDNDIMFETQKSYQDLRGISGSLLYYDFLVFKDDKPFCLIECQGEQHYRPIKKFGGAKKLLRQINNDKMKKDYADNVLKLPLYEILYTNVTKNDVYSELDKIFIQQ